MRAFHLYGLTPPCTIYPLATLGGPGEQAGTHLLSACAGTLLHAAIAAGLWVWLRRRFRTLTGRSSWGQAGNLSLVRKRASKLLALRGCIARGRGSSYIHLQLP